MSIGVSEGSAAANSGQRNGRPAAIFPHCCQLQVLYLAYSLVFHSLHTFWPHVFIIIIIIFLSALKLNFVPQAGAGLQLSIGCPFTFFCRVNLLLLKTSSIGLKLNRSFNENNENGGFVSYQWIVCQRTALHPTSSHMQTVVGFFSKIKSAKIGKD